MSGHSESAGAVPEMEQCWTQALMGGWAGEQHSRKVSAGAVASSSAWACSVPWQPRGKLHLVVHSQIGRKSLKTPSNLTIQFYSTTTSRQITIADASFRPDYAFSCVWSILKAGSQVSVFEQGETSATHPVRCRAVCTSSLQSSTALFTSRGQPLQESTLNKIVVNLSSTVIT